MRRFTKQGVCSVTRVGAQCGSEPRTIRAHLLFVLINLSAHIAAINRGNYPCDLRYFAALAKATSGALKANDRQLKIFQSKVLHLI